MKAIFYRYGSVYEPDMMDLLIRSGYDLVTIDKEITDKDTSDRERIQLVSSAIDEHAPDLVYSINYYPAISEVCRIYKVIYASQTVDSPIFTLFDKSIKNETNRIFLFDRAQYELFSPFNPDCIFHRPLISSVERFDKVISSISASDRRKFSGDIAFVGSTYREKDPYSQLKGLTDYTKGYVNALIEASLKIYGYYPVKDALNDTVISDIKKAAGNDFPHIDGAVMDMDAYAVSHRYIGSHLAVVERERTLAALAEHFSVNLYTRSDTSVFKSNASDSNNDTSVFMSDTAASKNDTSVSMSDTAASKNDTSVSKSDTSESRNNRPKFNGPINSTNAGPSGKPGLYVHPGVNTLTEMPKIFNLSRINLNMTMRPIEKGLPLRCFDILGCGGFLMTNYQEELDDMFVIGRDLEAYSSLEELIDKCAYYLTHEEERAAIARRGRETGLSLSHS
ncbi:MAG: DUF3880 domain-containing protein [Lachnospiraceae bacterium]|nr:DUF3880 domain-containing protein [Lachnospiraceae bacterium]